MKPEVYILQLSNGLYYIGSTINIDNRFLEHQKGLVKSTKNTLPAKLVFHQEYVSIKEARQVEYRLKKKKSRKIVETIIRTGNINIK